MDSPHPAERRPGLLAALVLSFAGMSVAMLLVLTALCVYAGVPLLGAYCLAGIAYGVAAGVAAWTRSPRRRRGARGVLVAGSCLLLGIVGPWSRAVEGSLVEDRTLPGYDGGQPWFGGIPEDELVRLGAWVMSTPGERRRSVETGCFDGCYARIAEERVLPDRSSRVLDTWLFDRGHYWLAAPEGPGPFPLLVFLHGNAGPFQFYPHALAQTANEAGYAVAFPSWGFGVWDRPAGYARVEAVVAAVEAELSIDPERVVVGGLSAGGFGALGAIAHTPERFQACLIVPGTTRRATADPFLERPLLLLHGELDDRVPAAPAAALAAQVSAAGGPVRYVAYPDADHYLLLTHQGAVLQEIRRWLVEVAGAR